MLNTSIRSSFFILGTAIIVALACIGGVTETVGERQANPACIRLPGGKGRDLVDSNSLAVINHGTEYVVYV